MNRIIGLILLGLLTIGSIAAGRSPAQAQADDIRVRKIVVFQSNLEADVRRRILEKLNDTKSIHDLNSINAQAVDVTPRDITLLKNQPGVLRIDDDVLVSIVRHRRSLRTSTQQQPNQTLPWGIERIGANQAWSTTTAANVRVGVIDTGIDLTHPDLQERIKGSYNAIRQSQSAQDDNGHGTHIAGIVGAADNAIGVVGASPRIDLYAIKSLNRNGLGYISDIIKGIDWAVAQRLNVINLSIGVSSDIPAFHDAIRRADQAGVVQVAAAGNNGGAVLYPAAYPEVIAVSAISSGNQVSQFSSTGPEIDLAAPGEGIASTYPGALYREMTGTSMAAPHVTGAAALLLSARTPCGGCTPGEVRSRLQSTAIDLGVSGHDNSFGHGLINAYRALTR